MTINDIKLFLAVVKYGTITKASERLFIGHSTLSWHIQKIEEELGVTLFQRNKGKKNVTLTKDGEIFLPYAKAIADAMDEALESLSVGQKPALNIAIGNGHSTVFATIFSKFSVEHPDISLHLITRHAAEAFDAVEHGEVDAGFTASVISGKSTSSVLCGKEKLSLVCGSQCEFYNDEIVSIDQLHIEDEVKWWGGPCSTQTWQEKYFGKAPKRTVPDDYGIIESLLDGSKLWTVLPTSTASIFAERRNGISIKQTDFECPSRNIYFVTRSNYKINATMKGFLNTVKTVFEKYGIEWCF